MVVRLGASESKQLTVVGGARVAWGLAESAARPAPAPQYPVEVSTNGRYLVDQRGRPWRIQADAGWLIPSVATSDELEHYLAVRRAQGFNSFYLMAMVHPGGYDDFAPGAPNDRKGDPPLAVRGEFRTAGASAASKRYWRWIDAIIDRAATHGMVVMLAYTYLGFEGGDMGWYQEILAQPSRDALYDWGVWLGDRYRNKANLIWLALGDFSPPTGSEGSLRARAIAEGIRSTGAGQPFVAEPSPPDEIPGELPDFRSIVDLNSFYGYGPGGRGTVYETADRAWRSTPVRPAWMQEGTYEYENNWRHFSGEPWDTRRGRFWSVLAGGTAGDGFGSKDVWQWHDISRSLSTPGARYSTYAFDLFGSLPWWKLEPSGADTAHTGVDLIASGNAPWGALSYITAARTSDHDWLLAYVPVQSQGPRTFSVAMSALTRSVQKQGPRTFSVAMSALEGVVRARWFDPTSGNYLAISDGYEYASRGERSFTTPGQRGDGTDDWLLVLDTTGQPRCGTITTKGVYTGPNVIPEGVRCAITAAYADPSEPARAAVVFEGP